MRTAVKSPALAALGTAVLALSLLGGHEIALLFGGGAVAMLWTNARRRLAGAAGLVAS